MGRIPQGEEQCSAFSVSSGSLQSLSCIYINYVHYILLITCANTVESFLVTREYTVSVSVMQAGV